MARKHGFFRPHVAGLSGIYSTTLREGGVDIISSIFADGTDGFYFDFSKTDRLFQAQFGALSDTAGENIGVALESHAWGGGTLAQQTELVTDGSFSVGISQVVAARSAVLSWDGSQRLKVEHGGIGEPQGRIALATSSGVPMSINLDVVAGGTTAIVRVYAADGTTTLLSSGALVAGTYNAVVTPTGSTTYLSLGANTSSLGVFTLFDNVSVKRVPGNHGLQATVAAQPKWQAGGLARFDGSDDYLLTTLVPASAFTFLFKLKLPTTGVSTKIISGSRSTTDTRAYIALHSDGTLGGGLGPQATNVIKGSVDRNGTVGVACFTFDGTRCELLWNAVREYEAAQSGGVQTTVPIALGGWNDNGTPGGFGNPDIYHALAIKKRLTQAEIAAITNLWGTS